MLDISKNAAHRTPPIVSEQKRSKAWMIRGSKKDTSWTCRGIKTTPLLGVTIGIARRLRKKNPNERHFKWTSLKQNYIPQTASNPELISVDERA